MASSSAVSALCVLLLVSTASAQLNWGRAQDSFLSGRRSCENQGHLKIENAATYCCKISAVAYHCLAVLGLENQKSAIVEQSGSGFEFKTGDHKGENRAEIECHFVNNRATMDDLTEKSWLFRTANESYTPELQQPTKVAETYIGGYNSAGVLAKGWKEDPNYQMTLAGLKEWSQAFLKEFPAYRATSWNCQKYSVGVYNAVTHSDKWEKQAVLSGLGRPFENLFKGSTRSSASSNINEVVGDVGKKK
ncbi:unnamed protein product [Symbiodinium sp. CCMP2456]|nr:unnamed protein product [Symbiodinium sp. CCMP2456]